MKKARKYIIWLIVIVVIVIAGYFSFGRSNNTKTKTVTIGIMTGTKRDNAIWDTVKKTAKDKYNLKINLKEFTDYSQPNKALSSHNIDLNSFQNYKFQNTWNEAHDSHIISIGKTVIEPLRIYSKKVTNVKQIKTNSTIAVPNDATNEARALKLLQTAGLITLKPNQKLATTKSIAKNPKNLKIKEVDASQTAHALPNVEASVINGNYAIASGVKKKTSIFVEPIDKNSYPYINIISANRKDKNKKIYKDVVKSYQTNVNKKEIKKAYNGLDKSAWDLNLHK